MVECGNGEAKEREIGQRRRKRDKQKKGGDWPKNFWRGGKLGKMGQVERHGSRIFVVACSQEGGERSEHRKPRKKGTTGPTEVRPVGGEDRDVLTIFRGGERSLRRRTDKDRIKKKMAEKIGESKIKKNWKAQPYMAKGEKRKKKKKERRG